MLEWDPERQRWELKLVAADTRRSKGAEMADPYFTDDEIRLDAVYLPLNP